MKPFDSSPDQSGLRAGFRSDRGRVRAHNEDASLVAVERGLFAVADGVGGQPAGDVAARVTIERLPDLLDETVNDAGGDTARAIEQAIIRLNEAVQVEAAAEPELEGMAATIVLALITDGVAHIANVGDSRAYLARGNQLSQLTNDHSVAAELVRNGVISQEEANSHPFAHSITQAIGLAASLQPAVDRLGLEPGDRLLLCTDGLTNMVSADDISAVLATNTEPDAASQDLVDAANAAGGKDNVTVVVVDYNPTATES